MCKSVAMDFAMAMLQTTATTHNLFPKEYF